MKCGQVEGKWKQFKGKVKKREEKLTEDEVEGVAGKRYHLAGKLQEKYGCAEKEANREIEEWHNHL